MPQNDFSPPTHALLKTPPIFSARVNAPPHRYLLAITFICRCPLLTACSHQHHGIAATTFCRIHATDLDGKRDFVLSQDRDPELLQEISGGEMPRRPRDESKRASSNFPKEKKLIQVMYGIAGDAGDTLHEFEVSLKSLLMSSPTDSDLNIHLLTGQGCITTPSTRSSSGPRLPHGP